MCLCQPPENEVCRCVLPCLGELRKQEIFSTQKCSKREGFYASDQMASLPAHGRSDMESQQIPNKQIKQNPKRSGQLVPLSPRTHGHTESTQQWMCLRRLLGRTVVLVSPLSRLHLLLTPWDRGAFLLCLVCFWLCCISP